MLLVLLDFPLIPGPGELVRGRGLEQPCGSAAGVREIPHEIAATSDHTRLMADRVSSVPLAVVALGGNALLRRGEPATAANQLRAARAAAQVLGPVSERARLVVTHGNGPQVGLLALKEDAYGDGDPYPLDVLDAETEGQIGYVVELELDNVIDHQDTVTVITRVLVDADDPAFGDPTKFIGPVYDEQRAAALAAERGWVVKPDGDSWRRVVASPDPKQIVQLGAIRSLVDAGFLVVCVGGGGVPVIADGDGHAGVEAVIDKDLASALLAIGLGADVLALATDVDAVYTDWGTPDAHAVTRTSPTWLRAQSFAGGSMAPKVEAACRFVEATGKRAAIGRLEDMPGLIDGIAGTQIGGDHVHELVRLHEVQNHNLFAIRNAQDQMGARERELASKLRALGESEAQAEVSIEREWRREHFGHDLERPPAWRRDRSSAPGRA
jgi:carbamate kinase